MSENELKSLPKFQASDAFLARLHADIPFIGAPSRPFPWRMASFAMAASLACGVLIGNFDLAALSDALAGLGVVEVASDAGIVSLADPYSAAFTEIAS